MHDSGVMDRGAFTWYISASENFWRKEAAKPMESTLAHAEIYNMLVLQYV
jgi:hypothetical protein